VEEPKVLKVSPKSSKTKSQTRRNLKVNTLTSKPKYENTLNKESFVDSVQQRSNVKVTPVLKKKKQKPFSLGTSYIYRYSDEIYSGSNRVANSSSVSTTFQRLSLSGSYQLNSEFIVSANLPFTSALRKEDGVSDKRIEGLGDASVTAIWLPWRNSKSGITSNLRGMSFSAGLILPTGETANDPRSGAVNPSVFQLGTGAFQGVLGVSYGKKIDKVYLSAATSVNFALEESSNGFRPSNSLMSSINLTYPIKDGLNTGLGINLSKSGRDRFKGVAFDDTGSTNISLTPAISWRIKPDTTMSASVAIPIYQNVNETALAAGSLWQVGLRYKF
jgi:hypothetical protein